MTKFRVKLNLDTWADINAETEEEAIEEFEMMNAQSPVEPEISVEELGNWVIKDLSTGETIQCEDENEVLSTLYRPIVEKCCDVEDFEVRHGDKVYKPFLLVQIARDI